MAECSCVVCWPGLLKVGGWWLLVVPATSIQWRQCGGSLRADNFYSWWPSVGSVVSGRTGILGLLLATVCCAAFLRTSVVTSHETVLYMSDVCIITNNWNFFIIIHYSFHLMFPVNLLLSLIICIITLTSLVLSRSRL